MYFVAVERGSDFLFRNNIRTVIGSTQKMYFCVHNFFLERFVSPTGLVVITEYIISRSNIRQILHKIECRRDVIRTFVNHIAHNSDNIRGLAFYYIKYGLVVVAEIHIVQVTDKSDFKAIFYLVAFYSVLRCGDNVLVA